VPAVGAAPVFAQILRFFGEIHRERFQVRRGSVSSLAFRALSNAAPDRLPAIAVSGSASRWWLRRLVTTNQWSTARLTMPRSALLCNWLQFHGLVRQKSWCRAPTISKSLHGADTLTKGLPRFSSDGDEKKVQLNIVHRNIKIQDVAKKRTLSRQNCHGRNNALQQSIGS
jgi:hypothetical protein